MKSGSMPRTERPASPVFPCQLPAAHNGRTRVPVVGGGVRLLRRSARRDGAVLARHDDLDAPAELALALAAGAVGEALDQRGAMRILVEEADQLLDAAQSTCACSESVRAWSYSSSAIARLARPSFCLADCISSGAARARGAAYRCDGDRELLGRQRRAGTGRQQQRSGGEQAVSGEPSASGREFAGLLPGGCVSTPRLVGTGCGSAGRLSVRWRTSPTRVRAGANFRLGTCVDAGLSVMTRTTERDPT